MKPSILALSLSTLITTICAKNTNVPGYQLLNFDVTRGDTFGSSSSSNEPKLVKRADEEGTVNMILDNQSTFYSVTLKIGSQEDEVIVLVDTGSSDLWVSGAENPYCRRGSARSTSPSSKFRKLEDKQAAVEILGEQNYREILHDREQIAAYKLPTNGKFRKLDDVDAYSSIFSSSAEVEVEAEEAVEGASKSQNKALGINSASSSIATMDCSEYGTFDHDASTSYQTNDTDFFILYGDRTYALGTWGYDNIKVGDLSVPNLSFAVANQSNSSMGVLGIGLEELETTNSGALVEGNGYTYPNLPSKLVEDGLINRRVYSLWLNSRTASTGSVLFGAVDHAKYDGDLTLVPVVNTLADYGYRNPVKLEVTLSSISLNGSSGSASITRAAYPALLDSGTTLTYLPQSIVSSIARQFDASFSSSYGYYILDCPTSNNVNFIFNFQGVDISVPLSNFVLSTGGFSSQCVLALIPSDDIILGDSFLREAYIVYDLDNYQIGLAQAKFTDEEDIEVISSSIPSAVTAAQYAQTYGASGVETGSVSFGLSDGQTTTIGAFGSGIAATNGTGARTSSRSASSGSTGSASATASSTAGSGSGNSNNSGAAMIGVPSLFTTAFVVVGAVISASLLSI